MSFKHLTSEQKEDITVLFVYQDYSLNALARDYNCHRSTIVRTLEDKGINPGIRRRPVKVTPIPAPVPVVIPTKTPWWKRIFGLPANTHTECRV